MSGLIILGERPIRIGDVVTVGDVTGTVARIRARATVIVDSENKEVLIPNKSFITDRVINWTLTNQTTRMGIKVSVGPGDEHRGRGATPIPTAAARAVVLVQTSRRR